MTNETHFILTRYAVKLRVLEKLRKGFTITPTTEDIQSVQHQVVSDMAYRYWELDNKQHGKDQEHWLKAEKDFIQGTRNWK
jgi:hypothetical protein